MRTYGKDFIFLVDLQAVSPAELSYILADIRLDAFTIYLIQDLQSTSYLIQTDPQALMRGFSITEFSGGLLYLFNLKIKRLTDLLISLILLPLFTILFVVLALLIRLETKGPILFTQERIGRNGKKFKLYKFRTMFTDAQEILISKLEQDPLIRDEWEKFRKLKNDPRVTKIGRILRRFSLDELPQIINVLKGDMSLVGPRPVTEEELLAYYREYSSLYKLVPPGLTGLWQVSGRNNLTYDLRVKLDVYYILNWSLLFDIIILLKTIPAVLSGKGAY